ncbi:hypothetical protein CCHR01_12546 [Colletotrichum chrysophilum]|uniref:Uncharacterized protein n=1 Tax=Colletotrichum chrysophilum TaxID=1836956 RepID=A0AAD9ACC8_9PEZI|nr:hypothetical protein CCHR01_12546 [Colletotrichum chrysophilum]
MASACALMSKSAQVVLRSWYRRALEHETIAFDARSRPTMFSSPNRR